MNVLYSNVMNCFSAYSADSSIIHIRQHLHDLLGTRQASVAHIRDYGLPDIHSLLERLPESTTEICDAVVQVIDKFEPRLSHIEISTLAADQNDVVLLLQITAVIQQRKSCQFLIRFLASGDIGLV
jgi:type VI secretion system protein